jgi:hypothetical protein
MEAKIMRKIFRAVQKELYHLHQILTSYLSVFLIFSFLILMSHKNGRKDMFLWKPGMDIRFKERFLSKSRKKLDIFADKRIFF